MPAERVRLRAAIAETLRDIAAETTAEIAKLGIGKAGIPAARVADRLAERVMPMLARAERVAVRLAPTMARMAGKPRCSGLQLKARPSPATADSPADKLAIAEMVSGGRTGSDSEAMAVSEAVSAATEVTLSCAIAVSRIDNGVRAAKKGPKPAAKVRLADRLADRLALAKAPAAIATWMRSRAALNWPSCSQAARLRPGIAGIRAFSVAAMRRKAVA